MMTTCGACRIELPNVPVSDTTKVDSSSAAKYIIISKTVIANEKPRKKLRGLAFGIDRNQESFLRKIKIPADAMNAPVNCKNFFGFFSFGLYGV